MCILHTLISLALFFVAYTKDSLCIGLARVGREDQLVVSGTMQELLTVEFGGPLHSLVIAGHMHPLEEEYVSFFNAKNRGGGTNTTTEKEDDKEKKTEAS